MNIHKNARLTRLGRERIVMRVLSGQAPEGVARAAGVSPWTVRKWVARYKAEGSEGLKDRSSRPNRLHRPTPTAIVERVAALRRQRWTGKQIAAEVGVSPASVSRILKRLGRPGAGRAGPPPATRTRWRADPHRCQEARPLRARPPPHHRQPPKGEVPRCRLGVRPCRHRRRLAHRFLGDYDRREEGKRRGLPQDDRRLLKKPRCHRGTRDEQQRMLL